MAVRVVAGELSAFVARLQSVAEDMAALRDVQKEIMAEAKGQGYDPRIIRRCLAEMKLDADARAERDAMMALYLEALGELAATPLGAAAVERRRGEAIGEDAARAIRAMARADEARAGAPA